MSDQKKLFDLVRGIANLARTDCFAAFNKDAGKGYSKQQADVTDLVIQQHLNGICPIAVYPVLGDCVQVGTFDLDDKDSAAGWGGMVTVARRLVAGLAAAEVRPVVVRSGSGQGIHIHLFLAEATPAREVRRFMRQLLADAGHSEGNGGVFSGQVEVYPKQDRVLKGKLGNAIALPFARQSLPLDSDFAPVQLDDWEVPILAELLNDFPDLPPPPETKPTEWKSSDTSAPLEGDLEKCRDALKHVPADSYDIWVKVGLALKWDFGEAARPQWIEWSQSAPSKFPGIEEAEAEWCGFDPDGRIGIGTIFHLAKSYGWSGPGDEQLRDMNARFGILTHGRSIQIILKNGDRRPDDEFEWLSREAFLARLKPEKVTISASDGEAHRKEKARWWLDHPKASHYHRLDFDPARPPGHNGAIWNLWRGFAVQPMRGAWPRMREHIEEVIADGDQRLAVWLLNWLALGVQEAAKPIGTAPVLLGLPGTGKGFLANAYGALWNPHFAVVTHPEHVTGRFSGHLFAKRFLFIDEGTFGGNKREAGVIKTRITEPTIILEQKGVDPVRMKNRLITMVASNEDSAVAADIMDRRWQVFDVSKRRREDHAYFQGIAEELGSGGREAMLHDLLCRDLSQGPDPRRTIRTARLFDQVLRSQSPEFQYLHQLLSNGVVPHGEIREGGWCETTISDLFDDFRTSFPTYRYVQKNALGRSLQTLLPAIRTRQAGRYFNAKTKQTERSTAYCFPPLGEVRAQFEKVVGQTVEWEVVADAWAANECPI